MLGRVLTIPNVILVQGKRWEILLRKWGVPSKKIKVIPNWVPSGIAASAIPKYVRDGQAIRFVFVGRLVPEKGVLELIEAAANLSRNFEFEMVFAGAGECYESLRKVIDHRDLANIKLTGWLDRDGLDALLTTAHVFVMPTYHPEGFPNAILEAMAYGLPVISTDTGAISESVKSYVNGFLIEPHSPIEIAAAMEKYLKDHTMISRHSNESLRIVHERHDSFTNCRMVINAIDKGAL